MTKATNTKSKKELEDAFSAIRHELLLVREELSKYKAAEQADTTEYPDTAFTVVKIDGIFKFIEVGVNVDLRLAKVLEVRDASRVNAFHMAAFEGKRYFEDVILNKVNR